MPRLDNQPVALFSQGEGVHAGRRQGVHPPQVRQRRGDGVQLHVAHLPPEDEDQQREWAGSRVREGAVGCKSPLSRAFCLRQFFLYFRL